MNHEDHEDHERMICFASPFEATAIQFSFVVIVVFVVNALGF
jgi:hypothetical protein